MLRALKRSFTCTTKQRGHSHSRQRSILLHMSECASIDKDLDANDNATEDVKRRSQTFNDTRHSRHNSAISTIGRNNSMNDWQDIVTALKNVDRTSHNSSEQDHATADAEETVSAAAEEVQTQFEPQHQVSSNVASRLTPSATPLLHRKTSFEAAHQNQNDTAGERFVSEYNVRLEPVIKICIPCQHDHNQFHGSHTAPSAIAVSNNGTNAVDTDANSNSAAALMMRSINMAPARVEVAVEAPDASVLSAEAAAGDKTFQRLALEPPPPTPEMVEVVTPIQEPQVSGALPQKDSPLQVTAGDRRSATATTPSSDDHAAAVVEVGEWTGGDAVQSEGKKLEEEEEEEELLEPAAASEVEMSRQEALILADTVAHMDALMMETEAKCEAPLAGDHDRTVDKGQQTEEKGVDKKPEEEKLEEKAKKEEEEAVTTLAGIGSKPLDLDRGSSPASTSLTSFVDVYDKEPLHPTDDAKTSMSPVRRVENQKAPKELPAGAGNEDARVAPWLGGTQPTTSADRWKRMKKIVQERETAVQSSPPLEETSSMSLEVDFRLQDIMKNLNRRDDGHRVNDSAETAVPINDELRHILSTLSHEPSSRRESPQGKLNSPRQAQRKAPVKGELLNRETKRRGAETVALPPRNETPRRHVATRVIDEPKSRSFTFQMDLDANDVIVCSFLRPADRRVVAAAAKNNCSIALSAIEGSLSKSTRKFQCVVKGPSRDQVVRCINFLKDTFPKSYLRYNR